MLKPQDGNSLLTLQAIISKIEPHFKEEAKALQFYVKKDVVALGTDEAFALRDQSGEIRAFRQSIFLSLKNGTLVQPVPGSPYVISAQGYEVWAEAVGANVIFPKEVLVDGEWQQNPAVIRDEKNRRILYIYARAVAFRYSSKGLPMVSDWTTIFDINTYRLIDLLGKAKKYPQAFILLPMEMVTPKEDGTWAKYPFDESTNLWVNTAHEEALTWYAQILNREKKAIDFAQTFAKRNSLKHLSGLQKASSDEWVIPVICWRPTNGNIIKWDATRYIQLQNRVGRLIEGNGQDFEEFKEHFDNMPKTSGTERVSDDEGVEVIGGEIDPESNNLEVIKENGNVNGNTNNGNNKFSDEEIKILKNFATAKKSFQNEYQEACRKLNLKPNQNHTPQEAEKIMKTINEILDSSF
ncbi:MAG: hypothetical protein HQK79_20645 [Desulfobacterales bacterium]|nr:hypothetical protein [Desulfobacterales bacterium]